MLKKITRKDKRTKLEKEIDEVLSLMSITDRTSEEYKKLAENLEKLDKMKPEEKSFRVSADTIALGVFGIVQMLLILNHEKTDVITSKAFSYIWKGKV